MCISLFRKPLPSSNGPSLNSKVRLTVQKVVNMVGVATVAVLPFWIEMDVSIGVGNRMNRQT